LAEAFETGDRVRVAITYAEPSRTDPDWAGHPAWTTDVDPLTYELVASAEPGGSEYEDHGFLKTFTATFSQRAILGLLNNPYVVDLMRADPAGEEPSSIIAASHGCTSSSTVACVQSNRFSIQVTHRGLSGRVAAVSSQSATFWTGGSANWEVLAKVLNGCSINGHYWVFGAGATSHSYSITVEDTLNDLLVFFGGSPCPLTNITAFPC
jgi:hypothetical protein